MNSNQKRQNEVSKKSLIVGLGNIGAEYVNTRGRTSALKFSTIWLKKCYL